MSKECYVIQFLGGTNLNPTYKYFKCFQTTYIQTNLIHNFQTLGCEYGSVYEAKKFDLLIEAIATAKSLRHITKDDLLINVVVFNGDIIGTIYRVDTD